ncbi:MAG: helix-turn-helix domain-containing protein [Halobacteriales archaeon]|nr:helix-turn-helix domain-containing protein [Halobacteriales archaeon]
MHASLPYEEEVFLWTPEGGFGFHSIGDVVETERDAWAVAFDPRSLRVSTHRVTDHITNPAKRIYRVTLESGREVLVTKDHNLFTLDEEGRVTRVASEDAEGEAVMVPKQLPASPSERRTLDVVEHVDPAETTIYASDGVGLADWKEVPAGSRRHYESRGSAPMEVVSRLAMPDDVEVAFKQSDHRLPREIPSPGSWAGCSASTSPRDRPGGSRFRSPTPNAVSWNGSRDSSSGTKRRSRGTSTNESRSSRSAPPCGRRSFGELAGSGGEKTVPEEAFEWPLEALDGLLEGLMDGDGHRREERETLYTGNEDLANRVMYLAARLGRQSSAYSREREIYIPMSDVEWEGESWAVDVSGERHKRGQYVPVPSELLRELREAAEMRMVDAAAAMGYASRSSVSNVENREYPTVKRETLRRFQEAYADAGVDTGRIDDILDGDVRFEKVTSVEATDRVETTYDLEVQPDGRAIENFLGGRGGVFLSNTAGIVDPGYRGQITLELSNLGAAPVALKPGMRISQLTFTELKTPAERPYGAERGSKYQDQAGPQASRIQGDDEFSADR